MDCPNSHNCARCGIFTRAGSHGFRHRANSHWFSVCGLLHLCQERASEASAFTGTEQQHTPVGLLGLWFPLLSHVAHRDLNQLDVNSVHCVDDIILLGLNGQEVASAQEVFVRHSCLRGCKLRLTEIQGPTTPGQWLGDHQPGPARDILSEVRDNSSLLVAPTAKKEDQLPGPLGSGGRIFPTRGYCFSLYTRWCERLTPEWDQSREGPVTWAIRPSIQYALRVSLVTKDAVWSSWKAPRGKWRPEVGRKVMAPPWRMTHCWRNSPWLLTTGPDRGEALTYSHQKAMWPELPTTS